MAQWLQRLYPLVLGREVVTAERHLEAPTLHVNRTATALEAGDLEAEAILVVVGGRWFHRGNGAGERDYRIEAMGADIEAEGVVVAEDGEGEKGGALVTTTLNDK